MSTGIDLRRLYKNAVQLNNQRADIFKSAFKEAPGSMAWGLISYTFDEWLSMTEPPWQPFTTFESEISPTGFHFRIGSSFRNLLYPPAEVAEFIEYAIEYSVMPIITATLTWEDVDTWKDLIISKHGELINPAGVFLFAGVKHAYDMGWLPVNLTAIPEENKYSVRWIHPDRTQFTEFFIDYTGVTLDHELQMKHVADNKE